MMNLNQPKALEAAAQALAKHFGHDYSDIRMTDHYLRKKRPPDRQIVALVELGLPGGVRPRSSKRISQNDL